MIALPTAAFARGAAPDRVSRTVAAMGGRALLDRIVALRWLGAVEIVTPERTVRLGVETRIEPFVRARTDSWLMTDGTRKTQTLIVEPGGGWRERDGARKPLPEAQWRHEREQFGLYAYMLMRAPTAAVGLRLHAAQTGLPPVSFAVAEDGRLASADYTVFAPDGGEAIQQRFSFDGMVTDHGLRWPRRISIAQNGVSFFTLAIDRLSVALR